MSKTVTPAKKPGDIFADCVDPLGNEKHYLMREKAGELLDKAEALTLTARGAGRDLTALETAEHGTLLGQVDQLMARAKFLEQEEARHFQELTGMRLGSASDFRPVVCDMPNENEPRHYRGGVAPSGGWQDEHGKPVYVLNNRQRFVDLPRSREYQDLGASPLGQYVCAAVTGKWAGVPQSIRAAMSENADELGGFLVPDELSRTVIDKARAKAVLVQAGAQTAVMGSETLRLVKVSTDPTLQTKAENAAFSGTDVQFDSILLTSRTVGNVVTMSRELVGDAPNAAQVVEDTLAAALATEIDRRVLVANSGTEGYGIKVAAGISETTSVGAIAWEDLLAALEAVEAANETASAFLLHPTIKHDLAALTSGDGVNSAKTFLVPPPDIAALNRFTSTSCGTDFLALGDFSQVVIGIRQQPLVEISSTAGDAFEKHQIKIKITWRGDFGFLRPSGLHRLLGITT